MDCNLKNPKLLKFLEKHQDDFTLEFLEKLHKRMVDLKSTNHEQSNFIDYLEKLEHRQNDLEKELKVMGERLQGSELKLKLFKQEREKELDSIDEHQIDNIIKKSSAMEYLSRLNEKQIELCGITKELDRQFESNKKELNNWMTRCYMAEEQLDLYKNKLHDSEVKQYQSDQAVRLAENYHGGVHIKSVSERSMNRSHSSSFNLDQIPPPPALDNIPSIEEILANSK